MSANAGAFVPRHPPPGRALNTSTIPPVKCFRCGGLNHMSKCVFPDLMSAGNIHASVLGIVLLLLVQL